jgi:N-acetylglucosaminyl-diphospho-decaprenol L-rhamnosyltransferase
MHLIPDLTIVIVSFKSANIFYRSVKLLNKIAKIICIENSDNKEFKKKIERKYKNLKCILTNKNLGFGNACNFILKEKTNKYLLFINPDAISDRNSILNLINFIKNNRSTGIVAPINYKRKNKIWDRYGYYSKNKSSQDETNSNVDFTYGHMFLIKRDLFRSLNGFDKKYFLYFEDIDLCCRVKKKGLNITILKTSKVLHLEQKSTKYNDTKIQRIRAWHYGWGVVNFYKNNFSIIFFLKKITLQFSFLLIKLILSFIFLKKKSIIYYFYQIYGMLISFFGIKSYYR